MLAVDRRRRDAQHADPRFRRLLAALCWAWPRRPLGWSEANVVSQVLDSLNQTARSAAGLPPRGEYGGPRADAIGRRHETRCERRGA